jgi:hypothetical protein
MALRNVLWIETIVGTTPNLLSESPPAKSGHDPEYREVVTVLGHHVAGDGGGGTFYWDPDSGAPPDGGTCFAPRQQIGRWLRVYSGALDVRWFGARGDGRTDDTASVQHALKASAAAYDGAIDVLFPPGTYVISASLVVPAKATKVCLRGAGDQTVTAGLGTLPSQIYCKQVVGALLSFSTSPTGVAIVGLQIDGANGLGVLQSSQTWTGLWSGLLSSSTVVGDVNVRNCTILHSAGKQAKGLDLSGTVFSIVEESNVQGFVNGWAIYQGGSSTTTTLRKVYLNYNLECLFVASNVANADFNIYDAVFESSVVALSAFGVQMSLTNCYFENIGYSVDPRFVTPWTHQNMNINDVFSDNFTDDVPVNTAMHFRYGNVVLRGCYFAYLSSEPIAAWIRGVGMGSTLGAYGTATFDGCMRSVGNAEVFIAPPQENSGSYAFRVYDPLAVGVVGGAVAPVGVIQSYSDARNVTEGRVGLVVAIPSTMSWPEVRHGVFTYAQMTEYDSYTGPLLSAPMGGANRVGDTVLNSAPAAGAPTGWICVSEGNPGVWKPFGMIGV